MRPHARQTPLSRIFQMKSARSERAKAWLPTAPAEPASLRKIRRKRLPRKRKKLLKPQKRLKRKAKRLNSSAMKSLCLKPKNLKESEPNRSKNLRVNMLWMTAPRKNVILKSLEKNLKKKRQNPLSLKKTKRRALLTVWIRFTSTTAAQIWMMKNAPGFAIS